VQVRVDALHEGRCSFARIVSIDLRSRNFVGQLKRGERREKRTTHSCRFQPFR
jgi:hypothetical protein